MNKSVKNLLRISSIFYKWPNVSVYTCPIHCIRYGNNSHYDVPKGVTKFDSFNPGNNSDSLLDDLKTCRNVEQIIYTVESNPDKIKKQHILAALTSLYDISLTDRNTHLNLMNKQFSQMLKILYGNIKLMSVDEAVHTIKIVFYLNRKHNSDKSLIVQSLLHIIRSNINDISLGNMYTLSKILQQMKPTPLSEALTVALPVMFDLRLSTELDRSKENVLVKALDFATSFDCSTASIKIILEALLGVVQNSNAYQASSIYLSLTSIKDVKRFKDLFQQVLHKTLTVLKNKGQELPKKKLCYLLKRMWVAENAAYGLEAGKEYISTYDEELVDNCIKWILSQEPDIDDLCSLIASLNILRHVNFQLMDYAVARFYSLDIGSTMPELYNNFARHITRAIILADYKPQDWDNIKQRINKSVSHYIQGCTIASHRIYNTLQLATLGYYNPDSLRVVFTYESPSVPPLALLHLYQSVKTFYPQYTGPFPSNQVLEDCVKVSAKNFTTLKAALEQGLGDARYVQHNLVTKLGQIIDHAVVMRKGGYPIAISSGSDTDRNTPLNIETLVVPNDSQVILILCVPPNAYCRNYNRLKGLWVHYLKCLEAATGYNVVTINSKQWAELPSFEKISYLMQAIKFKCFDLSWDMNCR